MMAATTSLCESCAHMREVISGRGSRFLLCKLAADRPEFDKYPPQPVIRCDGFVFTPGQVIYTPNDSTTDP